MSESDLDPLLLERYVAGETTPAERARVEHWAAVDPSHRVQVERVRAIWVATGAEFPEVDIGAAWGRSKERLGMEPSVQAEQVASSGMGACSPTHSAPPGTRLLRVQRRVGASPHRWPWGVGPGIGGPRAGRAAAIAASVALVAVGAGLLIRGSLIRNPRSLAPAVREYTTVAGQRLSVILADGTHLTLAPASKVRVAADYGHSIGARQVELEGEAYFAVVHDDRRPFSVRTSWAMARDVGTAFDVRAYPEDAEMRIAVAEGDVALAPLFPPRSRATQLLAGDVAMIGGEGVTVRHGANIASLTAWRQGRLVFQDTPLRDVARDLGRAFDLDVTVGDSVLGSRRVTATFGDEPEDEVLTAVAQIVGGRYERTGRRVVIRPYHGAADWQQPIRPLPVATAQARPTA